jgi:hypothetical protein
MPKIERKFVIIGILVAAGITGGFLYWRFVGCSSGTCPITSKWYNSSIVGGLVGFLAGDSVNDFIRKRKDS